MATDSLRRVQASTWAFLVLAAFTIAGGTSGVYAFAMYVPHMRNEQRQLQKQVVEAAKQLEQVQEHLEANEERRLAQEAEIERLRARVSELEGRQIEGTGGTSPSAPTRIALAGIVSDGLKDKVTACGIPYDPDQLSISVVDELTKDYPCGTALRVSQVAASGELLVMSVIVVDTFPGSRNQPRLFLLSRAAARKAALVDGFTEVTVTPILGTK